jgi:hypothetical protein
MKSMDKSDLERRLEEAEQQNLGLLDEIKYLKEQLAKVQDEPEIPDKPDFKMDKKFYYLDSVINDVEDGCIDGEIDVFDFNMFHTADYANEFRRKCLLIAMILHCKWYCDKEVVTDFSDGYSEKWCVWYDHFSEEWSVDAQQTHESTTVYFTTEEAAQKCAGWMNKHWKEVLP